jgi:hypothetical protein
MPKNTYILLSKVNRSRREYTINTVIFIYIYILELIMDKMRMQKSSSKDSSRSARSTKSASAPRSSSSKTSNSIVKKFMKGLMTTEKLMKNEAYKNKGLVRLTVVLSPGDFKKKLNPEMQINKEFDAVVKGLKKTNNKPLKF